MNYPKPKRLPKIKDYKKLIYTIKKAMEQLEPDGNCCSICGDNDHQAWECHHNPISIEYKSQYFKCFHCGLTFTTEESAKEHFGGVEDLIPECVGGSYRPLENLLSKLPSTWYPALIIHMIKIAHNKKKYKPQLTIF